MTYEEENYNSSRFLILRFCPIPKTENSEISKSFVSLQFLVVHETQNIKFEKNGLRQK